MSTSSRETSDSSDMMGAVLGLPDQLEAAWSRYSTLALPKDYQAPASVVVLGMGGSAIGGELAAAVAGESLSAPLIVVRDYSVPAWVGAGTLAIASSFSGDTEETLSAFDQAHARGAATVALTSGGELAARAGQRGAPVVALPGGGQPRAALGWSLAGILGILRSARLIADPADELSAAVEAMRRLQRACEGDAGDGRAPREQAERLLGRIPMVYAPERLAPVAHRWKTQVNENAKTTALWDTLPELNHNTVVGYSSPAGLGSMAAAVLLEPAVPDDRLRVRLSATKTLLDEHAVPWDAVSAPHGPPLVQALWLVLFGDLTSVYLALLRGVDPTPVEAIVGLKARLAAESD